VVKELSFFAIEMQAYIGFEKTGMDTNGNGIQVVHPSVEAEPIFECRYYPCQSVPICVQVDKTVVNTGFLELMDGHCQ